MNDTSQQGAGGLPPTGHGIESLIERLRSEGIDAGRQQAERFVAQAQQEIEALRADARREADDLLAQARERIRIEQDAALGAIRLAFRDSVLRLKEDFLQQFGERLHRRIQGELADPDLLRRLLVAVVQPLTADSPPGDADLEALACDGEARMLAEGLLLLPGESGSGLRIVLEASAIELHVTDEALTALMLEHLLPRVRRHLDGGPVAHPPAQGMPSPTGHVAPAGGTDETGDGRPS